MNAAQRTRVIRLIKKIDKNPEFSNKTGIKNISEFTMEMQKKIVAELMRISGSDAIIV